MDAGDSEAISFPCPGCGMDVVVGVDRAGKRGRCWRCGAVLIVPASASEYAMTESPRPTPAPSPTRSAAPQRGLPAWRRGVSGWFRASARDRSALEGEAVALILLSVADLLVTYHLLKTGPHFYESNPVAQFVFARWNIAGMAVFKFSIVGFVVASGEIVERHRPGLGKFVVLVGCLASAAVVAYGLRLAFEDMAT